MFLCRARAVSGERGLLGYRTSLDVCHLGLGSWITFVWVLVIEAGSHWESVSVVSIAFVGIGVLRTIHTTLGRNRKSTWP